MAPLFGKKVEEVPGESVDDVRERRLEEIRNVAERFLFDLGLLICGYDVDFHEYVVPQVSDILIGSVEPFLQTGHAMLPNFGEFGEMRVEGVLMDASVPITVWIEFEDHSMRETATGERLPGVRRRMILTLTIDARAGYITQVGLKPKELS